MSSREYEVVLTPEEEGGYSVTAPALPSCISQGETREEALAMIPEAIELYLESLEANGDPIPGPIGPPGITGAGSHHLRVELDRLQLQERLHSPRRRSTHVTAVSPSYRATATVSACSPMLWRVSVHAKATGGPSKTPSQNSPWFA